MALTATVRRKDTLGNSFRAIVAELTFDSSYPTGGENLTPAQLGLSRVEVFFPEQGSGYTIQYDRTNSKLKAFSAGAEVANGTDLSTVVVRALVLGSG